MRPHLMAQSIARVPTPHPGPPAYCDRGLTGIEKKVTFEIRVTTYRKYRRADGTKAAFRIEELASDVQIYFVTDLEDELQGKYPNTTARPWRLNHSSSASSTELRCRHRKERFTGRITTIVHLAKERVRNLGCGASYWSRYVFTFYLSLRSPTVAGAKTLRNIECIQNSSIAFSI